MPSGGVAKRTRGTASPARGVAIWDRGGAMRSRGGAEAVRSRQPGSRRPAWAAAAAGRKEPRVGLLGGVPRVSEPPSAGAVRERSLSPAADGPDAPSALPCQRAAG